MASRNTGNLVQRHGTFGVERYQSMPTLRPRRSKRVEGEYYETNPTNLVVRSHFLDFLANERCLPLCSHDDAILSGVTRFDSSSDDSLAIMEAIYLCPLEVVEVYRLCAFPSGLDRSLATGPHKF